MLHELEQHSIRRRRVNESNQTPACAHAWCFVDQPCAFLFQLRERRFDVAHLNGDVMNSGAAFTQKLSHCRFGAQRLEQFDVRVTNRQHANSDALLRDFFGCVRFEPESVAPNGEPICDGGRGYSDVIDLHLSELMSSSTAEYGSRRRVATSSASRSSIATENSDAKTCARSRSRSNSTMRQRAIARRRSLLPTSLNCVRRKRSIASASASTPWFAVATVFTIGGSQPSFREVSESSASSSFSVA